VCCPTGVRLPRAYHSTVESCESSNDGHDRIPLAQNDLKFQLQQPPPPVKQPSHIPFNVPLENNETTPLIQHQVHEEQYPRPTIAHSIRRLVQAVYPVVLLVLIVAIALTIAEIEDQMLANVLGVLVAAMALAGFCLWMFVFKTSLTQTTSAI
jgi:hypothetical protein